MEVSLYSNVRPAESWCWVVTAPKRRWSFSLRTLFAAVTVLAVLLGWLVFHFNWIRQRHELLARNIDPRAMKYWNAKPKPFCIIAPRVSSVGFGLHLLGERELPELKLFLGRNRKGHIPGNQADEVELAARLFPEAKILAFRDIRSATQ